MRTITYLLLFFILIQCVSAIELFKGDVKDNVAFKIDDITHIARYYPAANKTSLLAGTDRVLIRTGECEAIAPLKYCIDSVDVSANESTGEPESIMHIRVLQSGPDLAIDRDVSTDTPNLNEEVEVTITLTNNGNERAVDANYKEAFPESVKVIGSAYDFSINGILWSGSIDAGKSVNINYRLKFQDPITYESVGEASFVFNNKINKVQDKQEFKVSRPYTVKESISAKAVDIGDDITYNISINNTDPDQELSISKLEISLPPGSVVVKRDADVKDSNGLYTYSGKLSAGTGKIVSITFRSSKTGNFELVSTTNILAGTKTFSEKFTNKIGIGVSAIVPEITFTPEKTKGGTELEIEAKITNNADSTVTGISIDMTSDIVEPRGWRDLSLEPGKKHVAFNKIVSAPLIDEEKKFFLKLAGSYKTSSGKSKSFELSKEVTILPQDKIVEFIPELIVDGRSVNITMKVKNVAPSKLTYVSLIDTFPKDIKLTAGSRDKDIEKLDIGEEITAYSYIVKAADTYKKDSFLVTTTFNALDKDEKKVMAEKVTNVTLGEATAAPGNASKVTNQSAMTTQNATQNASGADEDTTAEQPGFFKRIWGWIKGLFS
jgi:hypothetical protein